MNNSKGTHFQFGYKIRLRSGSNKIIHASLTLAAVAIISIGVYGIRSDGAKDRFDQYVLSLDESRDSPIPFRECEPNSDGGAPEYCVIGDPKSEPSILLWGDSHMLAWLPVFDSVLNENNMSAYAAPNSACPPILNVINSRHKNCKIDNDKVMSFIQSNKNIKIVVLSGSWSMYFRNGKMALSDPGGETGNTIVFNQAMVKSLNKLEATGVMTVVMGPVPTYTNDVPLMFAYERIQNRSIVPAKTNSDVHMENSEFFDLAKKYSGNAVFVDVSKWFCKSACVVGDVSHAYYRDSNHISFYGALKFKNNISNLLYDDIKTKRIRN